MPEKADVLEKSNLSSVGFGALLAAVQKQLEEFENDEDRLKFMEDLTDGYCQHCGRFIHYDRLPYCQCMNDE